MMNLSRKHFLAVALCAALLAVSGRAAAAEAGKVEVGKPAPNFDLPATQIGKVLPDKKDARTLSLKDLRGKNVVLYFYPKAMTPGCTKESCGFRDQTKAFAKLNTVIIGISTDNLAAQEKFTKKENLNFPLLADADKTVTKEYGVLNPKRGLPLRKTFVIDKEGVVRKIYNDVSPVAHPKEVLTYIKEHLAAK